MDTLPLIVKKRDGGTHSGEEIRALVAGYTSGEVPEYQMSAWLMAVVFRGLTELETFALTAAMAASGTQLNLSSIPGPFVDKHSTGGVGDKTSLAVVPILASAGVRVVKMSGRGLGHTGGTLDKLEAISGMRVQLTESAILAQIGSVGACICAQTDSLVPADRKLYALRDVTGTVDSLPLIAASIMSKKLAAGASSIVLDVKVGSGAFMKTVEDARRLSELMIRIAHANDRKAAAVLSNMDMPLGRAIGNALDVAEVNALLADPEQADKRLLALIEHLAAGALVLAGKAGRMDEGRSLASRQIRSGAAMQKWNEMVRAQGGDPDAPLPLATNATPVMASDNGFVAGINALRIGQAAHAIGAGRRTKDGEIDPSAGIILNKSVGEAVSVGDRMATLYARTPEIANELVASVSSAFTITATVEKSQPLIYETIGLT